MTRGKLYRLGYGVGVRTKLGRVVGGEGERDWVGRRGCGVRRRDSGKNREGNRAEEEVGERGGLGVEKERGREISFVG